MAYSGEVRVDTRVTTDNIKKDLAKAEREIAKISRAFDSTTTSVRKQEIALSDLQRKYDALMEGQKTPASLSAMQTSLRNTEREIREVEKANKDLFAQYEAAAERAEALRPFGETDEQFIKAQEQADILFQRLEPVEQKFAELNAKAQDLRQSIAGVKMTPETSAEAQLLADKIKLTTDNINKSHGEAASLEMDLKLATAEAERLKGALGESGGAESARASIDGIGQAAQTAAKVSTSAFKTIAGMIGGIATGAAKAAKGILGVAKNILTLGASSRKASGGVSGLFKRLLQLGAAAFVFNVLRKGLRELSDGLRNALMANQEFAASFNAIKVNLLTAFSPIWEILEPAIVRFMQLLAQFTAVLARFMALLFGKTYTQARASAKALNDQSKAIKGVGGAAKEASKQLASFDEINKLAAESGGGGGGAGAEGLDFDFEEPPALAPWLEELANKLKSIFTEIDPDYWFNLGAALATWIADALNSIPWDKVQEWARVFAINLAGFLNGFLGSRELWEAIGHTIAQGLNTALVFLYTLLTNLDFYNIASAIGHGINKFIEEFDWKLLGLTIAAGINGIFDFAAGIIDTTKWAELGQGIADSFTSLTDNIKWEEIGATIKYGIIAILATFDTLLTGYDWGKLGSQFASLLHNAFTGKSMWEKLGGTLASALNAAISFLLNTVKEFNWATLGASLGAGVSKFIQDVNWDELGQLLGESIKGVLDFINTAIGETNWQAVGESVYDFLAGIDWIGVFTRLLNLMGAILGANLQIFDGFAKGFADSIKESFGLEFEGAGSDIVDGLVAGIKGGLLTLNPVLLFWKIVEDFKKLFKISSPSKLFEELGIFVIQGFLNGIKSLIDNAVKLFQDAWNGVQKVWGTVSKWFSDSVVTPVRTAFDTGLKNIIQFFATAWSNISKTWSVVFKWFETNIIEPVKKAFDASLKAIHEFFSKAWENIKSVWNIVKGWFETNVIKPIKDAFDTALKAVYDFFKKAWTDIQKIWEAASGWFTKNVTDPIKTAFDNAIKDITGFFEGLWKTISDIFGKIGELIGNVLDKIGDVISGAGSASKAASSVKTSGASSRSVDISPALFSPAIGNIEIPKLARGGIVDNATIALIGERGREAVVPLSHNAEWMEPLREMRNMIDETNRLLEKLISVSGGDTYLDGRLVSDGVFPYYESWEERRGKRIK